MGIAAVVAGFCWCLHEGHTWGAVGLLFVAAPVAAVPNPLVMVKKVIKRATKTRAAARGEG